MKRMNRFLAVLLALTIALCLLTACGNNSSNADSSISNGVQQQADSAAPDDTDTSAAEDAAAVWPEKELQLLVPANPGGGMSLTAAPFIQYFQELTGQAVVSTNNAGLPGYAASMELEPDGYNYFLGNATILTYKSLGTLDFGYEAYEPVAIMGIAPAYGVFVMADSGYATLQDLVEDMQANPGQIVIGNKAGTYKHLYAVLMLDKLECTANLVEFGDDAECLNAVLGGNATVFLGSYSGAVQQYVDSGDIVCLAVADTERVAATPDTPTFEECGYDFTFPYQMTTLVAPKGTDSAILDKLNKIIAEIQSSDAYITDMENLGSIPCTWDRATIGAYFELCQTQMDEAAALLN